MAVASNLRRNRTPVIRKGGSSSLPFKVAIVGWIDLLGYGNMIADVDYNPIADQAKRPINRLRTFHRIVAEHSARNFRTLVLNDGAVAYRDLSLRGSANTVDFFCRAWDLYSAVQSSEIRNGFAGARMVVAPGLRAKGSRRAIDCTSGHLDSILRRMADGTAPDMRTRGVLASGSACYGLQLRRIEPTLMPRATGRYCPVYTRYRIGMPIPVPLQTCQEWDRDHIGASAHEGDLATRFPEKPQKVCEIEILLILLSPHTVR